MSWWCWKVWGRTASIAFWTRSDVIRPLLARFLIRAEFEEPEDIQAMVCDLGEYGKNRGRVGQSG